MSNGLGNVSNGCSGFSDGTQPARSAPPRFDKISRFTLLTKSNGCSKKSKKKIRLISCCARGGETRFFDNEPVGNWNSNGFAVKVILSGWNANNGPRGPALSGESLCVRFPDLQIRLISSSRAGSLINSYGRNRLHQVGWSTIVLPHIRYLLGTFLPTQHTRTNTGPPSLA